MTRYYEDVEVGDVREYGRYDVTRGEILEFAEQYDPQPIHVDEEAARASMFGGLVASGWHTASMTMRMLVENVLTDAAVAGALGVDDLRWPNPVRPGDCLRGRTEVLDKEPWQENLGLVRLETRVFDDEDAEVLSMVGNVLYEKRDGWTGQGER